jgi:hypothetical protein
MASLRRLLRQFFVGLAAAVLLFEEWGWEPLAAATARLARLPLWAWVERQVARLPPVAALFTFFLPVLALLPVKILALYLIGQGHPLAGFMVLAAAKLVGTALVARLFALTEPALMQLPWFARWYPRWKIWKDAVIAQVRRSAAWDAGRRWKARARARWAMLRQRLAQND